MATAPQRCSTSFATKRSRSPFFGFIVVDESHRSIYNTFGEVLNFFKAIALGLTATPTDHRPQQSSSSFIVKMVFPFTSPTKSGEQHAALPLQLPGHENSDQFSGWKASANALSLEDQKNSSCKAKKLKKSALGSQLEQVINKGTNTLIVRDFMEENQRMPTACCRARPSSSAPPAHQGAWKKSSANSTRSTAANWARLRSDDPVIRAYGKGGLPDPVHQQRHTRIAIGVDMLIPASTRAQDRLTRVINPVYGTTSSGR